MKYIITGASKDTGEDMEVIVSAVDTKHCEQIAHDKGILVSAIKAQPEEVDTSPIAMDEDPLDGPAGGGTATAVAPAAVTLKTAEEGDPFAHMARAAAAQRAAAPAEDHHHAHYKVLINPNLMLLVIAVNNAMKDGWQLQGGIATCVINNATNYLQAVVQPPKE